MPLFPNLKILFPQNIEGTVYIDPTNTQGWAGTDVGAWINSAYAYLQTTYGTSFGGIIQLAPGTYSFSTPIIIALTGFSIILRGSGDGNAGTQLVYSASTGKALTVGGGSGNNGGAQIENFTINGTGIGNSATALFWGVTSTASIAGATAKNIAINGFGIGIDMLTNGQAYAIEYINCKVQTCATGYKCFQENNVWFGGLFGGCTTGVSITAAAELQMFGTAFDDNTTNAINIGNSLGRVTLGGCRFENPSLTTTSQYIALSAGSFNMHGGGFQDDNTTGTGTGFIQATGGNLSVRDTWLFSGGRTFTQAFNLSSTTIAHIDTLIAPTSSGISYGSMFTSGFAAKRLDWIRLYNTNTALQATVTIAGTPVYVVNSNLNIPSTVTTGIAIGTTFVWRIVMSKSAAGTAAFNIIIFRGTNGTTADTADVTQSMGTSTAAVDTLFLDIKATFTAVGASGSYIWSISPVHTAATATGFGLTIATVPFTGTVSAVNTTTANLKFGIGFTNITGVPTITVPFIDATAKNLD